MLIIIINILCYDIWFYISHIILHKQEPYKLIHIIHHSIPFNKLNYTVAHIAHFAENIIQPLGILIPSFIIEYNFIGLVVSIIIISIRGSLRHDDSFSWLIGNHHILHHKYVKYNFGEYWIDFIFNTRYPHKEEYIYGKIYT